MVVGIAADMVLDWGDILFLYGINWVFGDSVLWEDLKITLAVRFFVRVRDIPPYVYVVVGLAIVLLVFFLARPAAQGYRVYRALEEAGVPGEYVADVVALNEERERLAAELSSTGTGLQEARRDRDSLAGQYATCAADLEGCLEASAKEKKLCKDLADSLADEKAEVASALAACEEGTDEVIRDAARRICCAERALRDPGISGYELKDDRIECVNSGGEPLAC